MAAQRITIRDVARAAGVSTTTVSDALSGRGRMNEETRERVRATAEQLGYVASAAARNLRLGRSGTIGVYLPNQTVGYDYYTYLSRGAAQEALGHGYALTMIPPWDDAAQLRALHLDALIVSDPSTNDPVMPILRGLPVPMVTCEPDLADGADPAAVIRIDHARSVRNLLRHLRSQGARRIAALTPPTDTGFGVELRESLAVPDVELYDVGFAFVPDELTESMHQVLADRPDAILCTPDGAAAMAMDLLPGQVRVPEDMLFAAYTDTPGLALARPSVTAVDLQPALTGALAVRAALRALGQDLPRGPRRVATELRVRESSTRRR
ncbi:LacI family DNA-binding transcriptional regulator [Flexivirga sp. ID2601S]|uniref:LacI family DNA-binding transcriptional regulator n=1 Tax=Flexivirga aerilata TaxID=1656889 RepID=A0A849AEQ6_9MICO|nr:LacI family DNA-binding transcriptional regulator [Flexivirga aerilata]NNG37691.1 LacI family DNA-binding transcriptional regulator [Flexivirga aerilata]